VSQAHPGGFGYMINLFPASPDHPKVLELCQRSLEQCSEENVSFVFEQEVGVQPYLI
jgi:hypothetical protein